MVLAFAAISNKVAEGILNMADILVVGGGNMGEALAMGMVNSAYANIGDIVIAEPLAERAEYLRKTADFHVVSDGAEAAPEAQKVVIAVKPQVLDVVLDGLKDALAHRPLLISVVAGAPTGRFTGILGDKARIVRVMPNTPALVGEGAAGLCAGGGASESDLLQAKQLLESVGKAVVLPESLMDAVTGLSGSGPAYVFQFIEALADGGVRAGLPREDALLLAAQTVLGSARMLIETGEHPGRLKDMVASPGGTTIAGLHALENGGLRSAVMNAVYEAARRSEELGRG